MKKSPIDLYCMNIYSFYMCLEPHYFHMMQQGEMLIWKIDNGTN